MKFIVTGLIGLSVWLNVWHVENQQIHETVLPAYASDTIKKDPETGLIVDENLYMVKAQCTSCHSSKLIIANHFTRDGWKQKIRWMQEKHNLWDLGETEKQVLDYLEKNYPPTQSAARRAPLKDIKWYRLN